MGHGTYIVGTAWPWPQLTAWVGKFRPARQFHNSDMNIRSALFAVRTTITKIRIRKFTQPTAIRFEYRSRNI